MSVEDLEAIIEAKENEVKRVQADNEALEQTFQSKAISEEEYNNYKTQNDNFINDAKKEIANAQNAINSEIDSITIDNEEDIDIFTGTVPSEEVVPQRPIQSEFYYPNLEEDSLKSTVLINNINRKITERTWIGGQNCINRKKKGYVPITGVKTEEAKVKRLNKSAFVSLSIMSISTVCMSVGIVVLGLMILN